ncbi:MAG: MoxR family ATPase [Syntrophomonadaceae bacterium]|nr:MoxR family ATPase [Syntrophomonadaceae bacterium]
MQKIIDNIKQGMLEAGYVCDNKTATVLYLAEALNKPIIVEGPAGVGKTGLAQAYSRMRNTTLIRLQCYEGIDESKALYEWNYKRQLLHIQAIANKEVDIDAVEQDIFTEKYLLSRPLLQSISSPTPSVLLIDEIDKVDFEFEAMLLELLSEYQMSIPELGTVKARNIPCVFLTSNATRELSEALKRRCLWLYLDFPDSNLEKQILLLQVPGLTADMAGKIAAAAHQIRQLELKKHPSIAETLDWAYALLNMGIEDLDVNATLQTLNIIVKHREDADKLEGLLRSRNDLSFQPGPASTRPWR